MIIYLLRHAIAEPRGGKNYPDDDRPLTDKGRARMRRNARGMKNLDLTFDHIYVSRLSRSTETARIVKKGLSLQTALTTTDDLLPGADPAHFIDRLHTLEHEATVLAVGHEPHIGKLAATLIDAHYSSFLFRKGGLCRINLDTDQSKHGVLIWHLTPSQLRMIGTAR